MHTPGLPEPNFPFIVIFQGPLRPLSALMPDCNGPHVTDIDLRVPLGRVAQGIGLNSSRNICASATVALTGWRHQNWYYDSVVECAFRLRTNAAPD